MIKLRTRSLIRAIALVAAGAAISVAPATAAHHLVTVSHHSLADDGVIENHN